jgi:MFS family permease
MNLPSPDVVSRTLSLERWRAVMMGVFESVQNIFLLLIVVRWFHGSPVEKGIISAAASAGLLLAPVVVFVERRMRASAPRALAFLLALAALAMFLCSVVQQRELFILFATGAVVSHAAVAPFITSIYASNIPATQRGRSYASYGMIRIGVSILFATCAGWMLTGQLHRFPALLSLSALVLAIAAILAWFIPRQDLYYEPRSLLGCFAYLKTDRILRDTTVAWTLLGFGNLMMMPLRVEYLANPKYGLHISEAEIALLLSTVPNLARLVGTNVWGRAFDRMDFFSLRIVLNISIGVGTLAFFATGSWVMLLLSAALLGFATAGGDVAWNLWVTKFAPPERVSDYMAVHTFFAGVRGLIAPILGFALLEVVSLDALSCGSAVLIFSSVLVLHRIRR